MHCRFLLPALSAFLSAAPAALCQLSLPVIAPPFDAAYTLTDLGSPPGVPINLGGICFLRGDPNTLLIGGHANGSNGTVYALPVVRDSNQHITGYTGITAALYSTPYIDGGLTFAPNGTLLFTQYPVNWISQINSLGATTTTLLYEHGFTSSVGTLAFVPSGYPGAGRLLIGVYGDSKFYSVQTGAPDGSGFYSLNNITEVTTEQYNPNGPEGIVYVPRLSPLMPFPSMLVSEYGVGKVRAYDVGPAGQPIASTGRDFVVDLFGAEGGVIDPLTGDYLFSTYAGQNTIIVVRGFTHPACNAADMGRQGGQPVPDGLLDNNDFVVFIQYFFETDGLADVGQQGGLPGHDGHFDNNDFVVFINTFFSPCD